MRLSYQRFFIELLIVSNVFLLDQITKIWAKEIVYKEINSFFNIAFVHNYGTTFGFFQFMYGRVHTFIFVVILLIFSLAIYLFKTSKKFHERISYSLIIGGALGNIMDRMNDGYVTDFLQFHWRHWYYPTFNIADSFIVCGILLLLFYQYIPSKNIRNE